MNRLACKTRLPRPSFAFKSYNARRFSDQRGLKISEEVRDAVLSNCPVVALESAIYTHGFPYPDNVALAQDLEKILRQKGVVPATIGILDGVARVGMEPSELNALASAAGKPDTMKVSRRDLPYILGLGIAGRKLNGGTTISGTMLIADRAGIKIFGTGGLGGVHRGGEVTMDISADLTELGRTRVAVISSGCKSFLDIPRTLEYLETQGAGVFTFADGRTGNVDFPSFFTRESGVRSPMVVQNSEEAAAIIFAQNSWPEGSGFLFANPIPEEFSIPKSKIDFAIDQAVQEAAEQGFHGHSNTPFILNRIKDLTQGNSISANRALISSNITVAADVAIAYSKYMAGQDVKPKSGQVGSGSLYSQVENQNSSVNSPFISHSLTKSKITKNAEIAVLGSLAIDFSCDYTPTSAASPINPSPQLHTSNIASISQSTGGVGHNVALAAHLSGSNISVKLCSVVSDDLIGTAVMASLNKNGLDTSGIVTVSQSEHSNSRTAQYVAINDVNKDLVMAMADMSIFSDDDLGSRLTEKLVGASSSLKWVVVDANFLPDTIRSTMTAAKSIGASIAFEPVSATKSANLFRKSGRLQTPGPGVFPTNLVDLATPNQHELAAMHAIAKENSYFDSDEWWHVIDSLGIPSSGARDRFIALTSQKMANEGIPLQTIQLLPFIPTILTKLGSEGVLLTELLLPDDARLTSPDSAPWILSRCANESEKVGGVYMRLFPPVELVQDVVSVNGVGDTFLGVLIAGLAKGARLDEHLINVAQLGAVMTLRTKESVNPELGQLKGKLDAISRA